MTRSALAPIVLVASPWLAQTPAASPPAPSGPPAPPGIADNSFLIEEAYNQEHGVVQHISTLRLQRVRSERLLLEALVFAQQRACPAWEG